MFFVQQNISKRYCLGNWAFIHSLILENKAEINKNNYGTMLFMSKQVSCQKLAQSCKKWKSAQCNALFTWNPLTINFNMVLHFNSLESCNTNSELCSVCKNAFSNYLRCSLFVYHAISNSYFLMLQTL